MTTPTTLHPRLRRTLIAHTATATSKKPKRSKETAPPESVDE